MDRAVTHLSTTSCCVWPLLCSRVFGTDIHGLDCGDEASEWLTRYLGGNKTFRLVHHEPEMKGRRPPEGPFPDDEVAAVTWQLLSLSFSHTAVFEVKPYDCGVIMKLWNSITHEVFLFVQVVAYSDVAPVMLLSEASVQDLSSKLDNGVKVNRFRPNIVVSDCEAFAEVRIFFFRKPKWRISSLKTFNYSWFFVITVGTSCLGNKEKQIKCWRILKIPV